MLHILNFRMLRAFWENFGENFRRERPKIVRSRSRKTRMKPSKIGNPLPKSQLDFESFSLRPLRYISIFKSCCGAQCKHSHCQSYSFVIIPKIPPSVNWFSLQKRGRTQHQHARIIGIGQPVAADLPHKFPPVVEIFAKYYYFKVILYKRLPGSL